MVYCQTSDLSFLGCVFASKNPRAKRERLLLEFTRQWAVFIAETIIQEQESLLYNRIPGRAKRTPLELRDALRARFPRTSDRNCVTIIDRPPRNARSAGARGARRLREELIPVV